MAAASPSPDSAPPTAWLFGRGTDLLLGCGLASMLVLGAQAVAGPQIHALVPGVLLVLIFSVPHYGATLLRVYEDAADRRKYSFFAIYASVLLAALFVGGLQSALIGSLILTVYLTWSPWHYAGQNYGILLMLLGRRGVGVSPLEKRLIHASFCFSYALTFLAIHGVERTVNYAPVSYQGTIYHLMPLGIPMAFAEAGLWIAGVGYAVSLVAWIALLLRKASMAAIAPSLVLAATQSLWFSVPVLLKSSGLAPENFALQSMYGAYGFLWIAAAHAAQYLWITTYYAKKADASLQTLPYLGKAALAGFAIWTLPALIFAPGLLGAVPHESGLALMVASVVNLHHFVLDGAIWKLRDGRLARILLPASDDASTTPFEAAEVGGRHWLRPALLGLGALCMAYGLVTVYEEHIGYRRAMERGDLGRARVALDRFAWLGRASPSRHLELGVRYAQLGDRSSAQREFLRSAAIHPNFRAWQSLGRLHQEAGSRHGALRAYEEALSIQPDEPMTLYQSGVLLIETGQPERAIEVLERAAALAPQQESIRSSLQEARSEAERSSSASRQSSRPDEG